MPVEDVVVLALFILLEETVLVYLVGNTHCGIHQIREAVDACQSILVKIRFWSHDAGPHSVGDQWLHARIGALDL
jgi:hypothetical protein